MRGLINDLTEKMKSCTVSEVPPTNQCSEILEDVCGCTIPAERTPKAGLAEYRALLKEFTDAECEAKCPVKCVEFAGAECGKDGFCQGVNKDTISD